MSRPYRFFSDCVRWDRNDVPALSEMISTARDITRRTFLAHVDPESRRECERMNGYELHGRKGLTMARDYHVSYHRGTLHGRRVYFYNWSAIEHVFTLDGAP